MTKNLENELNLPSIDEAFKEIEEEHNNDDNNPNESSDNIKETQDNTNKNETSEVTESSNDYKEIVDNIKSLEKDIKTNYSFSENDEKMEELQNYAIKAHKRLFEAGYDAEPSRASNFFEPSMQALNLAMDMEKTKIDKKMKFMKQKIDEERTEIQKRKVAIEEKRFNIQETESKEVDSSDGEYIVTNKKELLDQLHDDDK